MAWDTLRFQKAPQGSEKASRRRAQENHFLAFNFSLPRRRGAHKVAVCKKHHTSMMAEYIYVIRARSSPSTAHVD